MIGLKAGGYARIVGDYRHAEIGKIIYVSTTYNEVIIDFVDERGVIYNQDELISYYEINELFL